MKDYKPVIIPGFIFIISLLARFALISKGPFHLDSLNLVMQADKTLQTGQLQPLFGWGYPLTVILAAFFISLAKLVNIHDLAFAVNSMSVVCGAGAVLGYYLFVKRFINEKAALFSSLLLSFHPFFFGESTYGMSHAPSLLFLSLGLLWLVKYQAIRRPVWLFLSGAALGLMAACRLQDLILMLIPISFLYFRPIYPSIEKTAKSKNHTHFLFFLLTITVVGLLFHLPLYLHQNREYVEQVSTFWNMGLTSNFIGYDRYKRIHK